MEERLHKVLAAAGVASRREAERLIAAGQVAIDGEIVTQMGVKVDPEERKITVSGRPVPRAGRRVYVLLNKPAGYVTTRSDPHAGRTVMQLVSEVAESIYPVGRLDKDTEGALLLTNDGDFTLHLTHPRHGVPKLYQAHVEGVPDDTALERLRTGVRLEEGMTAPAHVRVLFAGDDRSALEITLHEGRNRQVRRMLDAVGLRVRALRRVAVGPISVRGLPLGAWRYLSQKEVHSLLKAATGEGRRPAAAKGDQGGPAPAPGAGEPAETSRPSGPPRSARVAAAPGGRTRRPPAAAPPAHRGEKPGTAGPPARQGERPGAAGPPAHRDEKPGTAGPPRPERKPGSGRASGRGEKPGSARSVPEREPNRPAGGARPAAARPAADEGGRRGRGTPPSGRPQGGRQEGKPGRGSNDTGSRSAARQGDQPARGTPAAQRRPATRAPGQPAPDAGGPARRAARTSGGGGTPARGAGKPPPGAGKPGAGARRTRGRVAGEGDATNP